MKAAEEEKKRERMGKAALRNEGNGNVIIGKVAFQVGEKKILLAYCFILLVWCENRTTFRPTWKL